MDRPAPAFDANILASYRGMLQGIIDNGDLSGAVTLIWRSGEIVDVRALGLADIAAGKPMRRDTLFRIASMTKPVTSVAALMLMEEGAFQLSDSIEKWAPELADMPVLRDPEGPLDDTYPAPRAITFEDLLTHRAGLAYSFSAVGPIAHAYHAALGDVLASGMDPDAWMKALGRLPLVYPPGERLHYSHATDVLGFIVGRIAGTSFREVLMEKIFAPLGMGDTDFYIPPEKRARAAVLYKQDDATGALSPVPFRLQDTPPAYCGGGGGLISTAEDYLKFARMLLGRGEADGVRLLKSETVDQMVANHLTPAQRAHGFLGMPFWESMGFGLGVSMVLEPEKHEWMGAGSKGAFGWPGAFGTWWQADPAQDLILIFLIQNHVDLGPEAVTGIANRARVGALIARPMFEKTVYAALRGTT